MNEIGYVKLHREIREGRLWQDSRPFSFGAAWVDLLLLAAWQDHKILHKGKFRQVKRGELWTTIRFLAKEWGWSRNAVWRFLRLLESDQMITLKTSRKRDTGGTVLFIVNYDYYQSNQRDTDGTQTGHKRDYHKKGKKGKNKERDSVSIPEDLIHSRAPIEDWLQHKREKGQTYKPTGLKQLWAKLRKWSPDEILENINHSISNNYSGVFPPKGGDQRADNPARIKAAPGKYDGFLDGSPSLPAEPRPE